MRHPALTLALLACLSLPAAAGTGPQRAPSPAQQAQQDRMRQCSATAKERSLQGDPRKGFMKECLAKRPAA